jgi:hypothetical protein
VSWCWRSDAGKLTLDNGHDGALLDGRGTLETIGVDSTEELGLKVHVVEGVRGLIVVGLDLACCGAVLGDVELRGVWQKQPAQKQRW